MTSASSAPGGPRAAELDLLRLANQTATPSEFLGSCLELILRSTEASHAALWFEQGGCVTWCETSLEGASVTASGEIFPITGPQRLPRLGRALPSLEELLRSWTTLEGAAPRGVPVALPAGGSFWSAGSADPQAPQADSTAACVVLLPFQIESGEGGVLGLVRSAGGGFDPEWVASLERVAQVFGAALGARRMTVALTERVKELSCMYAIARIAADRDGDLGDVLQGIVEVLSDGWQFPAATVARIVLGEQVLESRGFRTSACCLSAGISVRGVLCGRVEVYRLDEVDEAAPGSGQVPGFLLEEEHLIEAVAKKVAAIVERKKIEEDRERLREQVAHSDRLATIGQLAAGVAHELNEPLASILGFAQLAQKSPEVRGGVRHDLDKVVSAALYASDIIRNLMALARRSPSGRLGVSLNVVAEAALTLIEGRCAQGGIQLVRELEEDLPVAFGDSSQIQQVAVNLVVNATQAMESGGQLTVSTSAVGSKVQLCVADTGKGIPSDDLARIFDPFFTTKDVGEGTGLGLSVAYGIVSAYGGTIHARSEVGRGTVLTVELPVGLPSPREGAEHA